jgi:hypothetical protein
MRPFVEMFGHPPTHHQPMRLGQSKCVDEGSQWNVHQQAHQWQNSSVNDAREKRHLRLGQVSFAVVVCTAFKAEPVFSGRRLAETEALLASRTWMPALGHS